MVAVACAALLLVFVRPDRRAVLTVLAKDTQAKLHDFQKRHGSYPKSLSEIGIVEDESGPLYYQMNQDGSYELSFGLELGESAIFTPQSYHHQ